MAANRESLSLQKEKESDVDTRQFLSFVLSNELFAIDIIQVKEIIEGSNVTRVPMMPDYVEGVINLRGNVVPVVNLALRFGRRQNEKTKTTSIIIVDVESDEGVSNIGIIVDAVDEVVNIPIMNIEKSPDFGTKIRSSFLSGIGKSDGKFIMLLNIDTTLNIEELSSLDQINEEKKTGNKKSRSKKITAVEEETNQ